MDVLNFAEVLHHLYNNQNEKILLQYNTFSSTKYEIAQVNMNPKFLGSRLIKNKSKILLSQN